MPRVVEIIGAVAFAVAAVIFLASALYSVFNSSKSKKKN
jgi:hypothetical protein